MSTWINKPIPDHEDFFTKLSFSTLICELGDKENIMMENISLNHQSITNTTKIDREIERWLNFKTDQELIHLILMWAYLIIFHQIIHYHDFPVTCTGNMWESIPYIQVVSDSLPFLKTDPFPWGNPFDISPL